MDGLGRVGVGLVAAGTVAAVVSLWPLVNGADPMPIGWYLAALLAPVGLGLILWSLLRVARRRGRRTRAASR